MKINPNQTRSLDRILNQELGGGTSLLSEGAAVKLIPGEKDQIQISQLGNRLQILVNNTDKFLLTERESQNFDIQGDQKNITIDSSVSLFSNQKNVPISGESQGPVVGIPAEQGEQLGHTRRFESSFGAAVTRGMITEELKEDGFINHIGKQMQRLLGEIGASTPQQTSFRTEKDLLPFLTRLEQISSNPKTGAIPFSPDFRSDLNGTVQKIQQEINNGGTVELEFLGSQITRGLKEVIDSKTSPSTEMQAGRIPFEEHEIPLGGGQRGAFKKWGIINEAITKNDTQMIREFASDASFMKIALPAEKAAFIDSLSKQTMSHETAAGEKMVNLQNIIQIFQSAQNSEEFKNIMNMAGMEKVQNVFKENPAEFNITAHLFQSGKLALDPGKPPFFGNEYVQGFSTQQIFAGRQQIFLSQQEALPENFSWSAEDAARFSENPLLLAIASPDEKASLIRGLQSGYVSISDNRSIVNVLQSAMNKTEFDRIVDSAGGKAISLTLQDPVSLLQWNRLAGAYDRMDLTTDFVEGVKYSGALLEPFPFEGNEPVSLLPLNATSILHDQSVTNIAGILETFMTDAGDWINNQIGVLERGAYVQAGLENLNHMMEELPLFNIPLMRNQLQAILQQPNVHSQHILNHLQKLASDTGLGSYELRNLISQPLAFVYQAAASEAETLAGNAIAFLQENFQLNVFQYGPKSPQGRLIEGQIEQIHRSFLPFAERLRSISSVLSEAFPAPADFITSLSKFTSEFNKNFVPILSNAFPDLSAVASQIFQNAQTMEQLVNGKYQISAPTTPGVPTPSEVTQLRSYLTNVMEGMEAIRSGNIAREFSRVGQELLRVPDMPRDLIQFTKQAESFLSSIRDGSYAKNLKDVAAALKDDDPIAELTKTTAQNGATFLMQLHNGSFSKVHEEFFKELDNFQNNPGVSKMNEFFERLSSLTKGILGGSDAAKITDEAVGLISETESSELGGSLASIVKAATAFRQSPAFRKLIELLDGGGKFLIALSQGNFAQSMELMNSRFGYSPAVAQIIERGLHLTTTGSNVLKTLIVRDFERPIAQLMRKAQAKTQAAKEVIDAENVFAMVATPFYALTEVENMDRLWHYHRQLDLLNDKILSDPATKQFQKQIQLLAAEPDLKKSLLNQFRSFQNVRSQNSKS